MYLAAAPRKGWGKEGRRRAEGNPMRLWVNGRESVRDRWTQTRRKKTQTPGARGLAREDSGIRHYA